MPSPPPYTSLAELPFHVRDREGANALALELFRLHAARNPVYKAFLEGLRVDPDGVHGVDRIPFLPVGTFKNHRVLLDDLEAAISFTSSGTTGSIPSRHHVAWPWLYERSFMTSFSAVYGDVSEWRILALLPSYLEREGSSLVHMARHLITASRDPLSGTYLNRYDELTRVLQLSQAGRRKTLLLGVTFALLDLAERAPQPLPDVVIMETGGMKGRRQELVREEVHRTLREAFHVPTIHSEYGMTELLSQAWSTGDGRYRCPPWMQVRIRDVNDPLSAIAEGRTGGIDVTDLCNIASCPFISTQDLGRMHADGTFEVLGRFDHSEARGCNLLVGSN